MGLLGGLALFLYGMEQMAESLKAVASERMKMILARLTTNRVTGALTGAFVTAVIQSSSVTTVLVVGFITAGLMSLCQSIGIITGANVGTNVTTQIIAFKVTKFALLMIAVGFGLLFFSKREKLKQGGTGLMGLGLVFLGMSVMGEAMAPLRTAQPFLEWMIKMETPAVGIRAGALFTALVQSSSATAGVVIVMASQCFMSLAAGIALIFGANIGTCITALMASIGRPPEAGRAALVHVLFNIFGVLVWLLFVDQLAHLVKLLSPVAGDPTGTAKLAAETPRQVANAHAVFNIVNSVIFLPLSGQLGRLVEYLVPDRPLENERQVRAKYLDEELLGTPSLALDRVRLEILHLVNRVLDMMRAILPAMLTGTEESVKAVAEMEDAVDLLHGRIVVYLEQINEGSLTQEQTQEFLKLMEAANDLENIGDIIQMKKEINRLTDSASIHQAQRLVAQEANRLPAHTVEMDILQDLKRIFYFAKRMARVVGTFRNPRLEAWASCPRGRRRPCLRR